MHDEALASRRRVSPPCAAVQQATVPDEDVTAAWRELLDLDAQLVEHARAHPDPLCALVLGIGFRRDVDLVGLELETRHAVRARHVQQWSRLGRDVLERDPRRTKMARWLRHHEHRIAVQRLLGPELEVQRLERDGLGVEDQTHETEDLLVEVELPRARAMRVQVGNAVAAARLVCFREIAKGRPVTFRGRDREVKRSLAKQLLDVRLEGRRERFVEIDREHRVAAVGELASHLLPEP